jgi:gliding motility-associated-like protein
MLFSQGGNTCNDALANPIQLPFFTNNQTLCGNLNDYNGANSCLANTVNGNPFGGQDWMYAVTPNQTGFLSIVMNDVRSTGTVRQILAVFQGCVGTGNCLTTLTGSGSNGISTIVPVSAGLTYYILLDASSSSNNNSANCFQYDLTVNLTPVPVQPACSNMGFENGNLGSWVATTGNSIMAPLGSPTPIYQLTGIGVSPGRHAVVNSGNDPCGGFPRVDPLGGSRSLLIGNNNVGAEAEQISQTFLVGASNSSFTYRYAVVFEDPGHSSAEQPFFIARLRDQNGVVIPCSEFIVSAAADLPGFFNSTVCAGVKYKPWSTVNVDLSNYLGQNVTAEFTVGDCSQGGHFGYAYVDASCSPSTLAALADTICPGESVTLTAPTGYESYTWNPGNITTQSTVVSPLVTTNYTLSLTAFNGCVSNVQIPITIAPLPVPVIQYQAPACDLPVLVQSLSTISSGTIANQQWNLGSSSTPSSSSLTNVTSLFTGPGTYPITLQLTSDQGCVANTTSSIIVPPCVFHIAITGDTICPGQCLSFPVQLSYGTPPYTYLWSNGSTASQINLCSNQSNIISLTVTDADGFIATDTAMITVAPRIVFESSTTDVLCSNQANATIFPDAQGWGPFTYTWSNGQTTSSLSGIAAGNYSLVVTDNFGCSVDTTFIITQPDPLFATLSAQPATCNQSNGVVQVYPPEGGTAPYEYAIDGGVFSSFAQFGGLSVGSHAVQVRDTNGCIVNLTATITMLSYPTQLSMNLTDATCGADNGVISPLQVLGGIAPFNLWVNGTNMGVVSMPISFDSLYAGDWNVELSDAHGCMIDTNVTLLQIGAPTAINFSYQPATCSLSNASLSIIGASGGTPAYTYSFNGGVYTNQLNYPNLPSGNATISVMDQNQCVYDTTVSISFIPDVEVSTNLLQNVQCAGGNDGQSAAIINSGTAPFQFVWTNGDNDSLATTLQAGTWSVFVTDANNCRDTAQVLIVQPQALQLSIDHSNPLCGISNGEISVDTVYGGTAPYNFRLNGGPIQSISNFPNLAVGTYTLQAIDSHGCSAAQQTLLTMPSFPTLLTLSTVDAVCGLANGEAHLVQIAGGVGPFQVQWIDNTFQTIESFPYIRTGLNAGSFPIHVFDANGCSLDSMVALIQIPGPSQMNVTVQVATCNLTNASLAVQFVNGGTAAYQYSFNNGNFGPQQQFNNLDAGTYSIAVRDLNGCIIDTSLQVSEIPLVQIDPFITHPITCYGYNDGALQADINHGSAPYSVSWVNGQSGINAENLIAGTYQVNVTDANGCFQAATIVLPQPDPVQIVISGSDYVCENEEILLIAEASGGTSHTNIVWPGFSTEGDTLTDNPNASRIYSAIATDVFGCAAIDSHAVLLRELPQGLITADVVQGCSPVCVNFSMNSSGTAALQSYNWNFTNGENGLGQMQNICFTESGLQDATVSLTDIYGCSSTLVSEGIVEVYPLPEARFSYNPQDADILNPEYHFIQESELANTYRWNFGDGTISTQESPTHVFPDTGQFTACLRVTSLHGCIDELCKSIEINPFPTIFAPNAFTPNGDGTNELFLVKVTYAKKFLLEIFDRWGELIYEGTDPLEGWNGEYLGNPCQEDVYVWRATVTNSENLAKQLIGRVTLID